MKRRNNIYAILCIVFSFFILNGRCLFAQNDSIPTYYFLSPNNSEKYSVKNDTSIFFRKGGLEDPIFPYVNKKYPLALCTNNSWMFGAGGANMYDTYLSPLKYKGYSLRIFNERMRRTTWFDYRFNKQQIIELEFAKGDNPAKNSSDYWLLANYRLGGHYTLLNEDNFRLGVGGLWDINAGVLYSERNGNNPASARVYTNLNLSVMASYKLPWFAVRWQIDSPFMGILFSPRYGQSYYEISLGNSTRVVNFASFHNQRALRNYITFDIPLNKYIIRVGYLGSYYQTKVHSLQTHHYTNSFVIGFPLEGIKQFRQKATNLYW